MLQYQNEFISAYNNGGGLKSIKTFQSANCCIALKGGLKLTISDTKYTFQFPSVLGFLLKIKASNESAKL